MLCLGYIIRTPWNHSWPLATQTVLSGSPQPMAIGLKGRSSTAPTWQGIMNHRSSQEPVEPLPRAPPESMRLRPNPNYRRFAQIGV